MSTHDALIEKLKKVLPQIDQKSQQSTVIKIRLADVFAERARLKAMAAGEKNCVDCKGAEQDRREAIAYYLIGKNALKNSRDAEEIDTLQRICLQLANLYTLNQQLKSAENVYREILRDSRLKSSYSKAYLGIGEIHFRKSNYRG
ncbi:MAG: hypothetical protein KDD35_02795, partial [Bdellovibrionales bacterium]|nr:hypothetical protein [Bdellovibrionales bacterium]